MCREYTNNTNFSEEQLEQIIIGINNGVDVSVYADPMYDWRQMQEIRLGLESKIDVFYYLNPDFDYKTMFTMRLWIEGKLNLRKIFNK